jgi:DNA primase
VSLTVAAGLPVNLERYPDGIDGQKIFQQRIGKHAQQLGTARRRLAQALVD